MANMPLPSPPNRAPGRVQRAIPPLSPTSPRTSSPAPYAPGAGGIALRDQSSVSILPADYGRLTCSFSLVNMAARRCASSACFPVARDQPLLATKNE